MQIGHCTLDYRRACALLDLEPTATSPPERVAQIPSWLQTELLAGDGERKLSQWAKRNAPPWTAPPVRDLLLQLPAYGDLAIAAIVAEVLHVLPPPVVAAVLELATIHGIGRSVFGMCGSVIDFAQRPFLISISAADGSVESIRDTAAEEIAHLWLFEVPEPGAVALTALRSNTYDQAEIPAWLRPETIQAIAALRREYDRNERIAAALVAKWGFRPQARYVF